MAPSPCRNYLFDAQEVVASVDEEAYSVAVHGIGEVEMPWDNHTVDEPDDGQSELLVAHDERIPVEWELLHREVLLDEKQDDDMEHAVEEVVFHKPGDDQPADELVVVFEQTEEDRVHHTFDEAEGSFASSC